MLKQIMDISLCKYLPRVYISCERVCVCESKCMCGLFVNVVLWHKENENDDDEKQLHVCLNALSCVYLYGPQGKY